MNGKEYIHACKNKLNIASNYKLALELEIKESLVNYYAKGERLPDAYACFKIAECLDLDPAIIIADIASESEKNPAKRHYFKSFMSTCLKTVAGLMLIAVLLNSTTDESALSAS